MYFVRPLWYAQWYTGTDREQADRQEVSEDMATAMAERTRGLPLPHLKAWRQKKLLAQNELAARSGLAKSTLARAERGDEVVNFANIRKLAEALGISTDELLHRDPEGGA